MKKNSKENLALTGGAAAAMALKQIEPEVMAVYPITPQTPIIETYAKYQSDGEVNTEIIQVESEHSALSACVGSSAAGARTVTATSSQGLELMHEILYIASGLRLPILMIISARALAAPLNIHGDHSDVMGARDTGWIQIFSENAQEAYDNTIIGIKLAEQCRLPVMVIMDGFITSHSVENLEILPAEKVKKFVGEYKPENYLLNLDNPVTFGPVALQNSHFEFKYDQAQAVGETLSAYKIIAEDFEELSGREKNYFEEYETGDAEQVIVLAGSAAGTAKDVVDKMRQNGKKVGLLKINLFRPFPAEEIKNSLAKAKSVAVLDRVMPFGTKPPFFMDIKNILGDGKQLASYVYGLGGRDVFASDIEKVFDELIKGDITEETKYIGLNKK